MTCIAGLVDKSGRVHMAGDSGLTDDNDDSKSLSSTKIFRLGGFLIGFCGSTEYCHAIRYRLNWPDVVADVDKHMAISLPDALRDVYTRAGLDIKEQDGGALLGHSGRLWWLDDFACEPVVEPYWAVGSGGLGARCVLAATREWAPRKRLQRALEAASLHCSGVSAQFDFLSI